MFRNRLVKVFRHISKQARRQGVTCYRLYDHDLPEFPFCIEFYGENLYVAEYKRRHHMMEEEHDEWMEQCIAVITQELSVPVENVFLKLRQRKAGRLGQYQKLDAARHEFIVRENGLDFIVNLSDYLDTGLFLDHRITRQLVRSQSAGKDVLNLFAYTGSFSVYAAAGNAASVTTVDLSKTYLAWAERNMQANQSVIGLPGGDSSAATSALVENPVTAQHFVHADVKQYLRELAPASFDLIILDPPTFSNSKRMETFLDIQADHVELINDCLAVLRPAGMLYFSTNRKDFVIDASALQASSVKDITRATTPFDFEGKLFRSCFLILR